VKRELRLLERHFEHWRKAGLLSPDLETGLRQASAELLDRSTSGIVRRALAGLGGGLLLAGLVLLVAENWEGLHRGVKLAGWAALQGALLLLAQDFGRRFPERPFLAEALTFVAGGWALGGIALLSQIYQLDARPPNGIWLWLALVLPAAWLLERRAVAAVVFVAIVAALTLEAGQNDTVFRVARADGPWIWIGLPLLAVALTSCLPGGVGSIREWAGVWIFGAANLFLLAFGAAQHFDRSDLGGGWWLAGPGLLLAFALPARLLPSAWGPSSGRLFFNALLPWALIGTRFDGGVLVDQAAIGVAWIAQLALAVLAIHAGARAGSTAWINLGYLALLAGILTRYFDFFGDFLRGGAALAMTGALMLFVLFALEKARRLTLPRSDR
jgi:uncharacterized membrane protein